MDILIKGMDMPCMCCLCPCHDWDMETNRYYCQALKDEPRIIDENTRRNDCPLVEVPTPHGRLIDADKVLSEIREIVKADTERGKITFAVDIFRPINNAPTVIDAEE